MYLRFFCVFLWCWFACSPAMAQEARTVVSDLRGDWLTFEADAYRALGERSASGLNTIYFPIAPKVHAGQLLRLESHKPYYLFLNGKIYGNFVGEVELPFDSLTLIAPGASWMVAIHQDRINDRDLKTEIVSFARPAPAGPMPISSRPYWHFRDFVVLAGLIIMLLFLAAFRMNPKLTADYFSIRRLFSSRDSDESQGNVRLTSSANVQFYVLCSLLIGFYLLIVFHHLPPRYALPESFYASSPAGMWLAWLKLSAVVFSVLLAKVLLIFALTRLFAMRGVARIHFFNWIRLLLVVFGTATVLLFTYFIGRGSSGNVFVLFLLLVVVALIAWLIMAFFKLAGRSGHSMFHLFSYLCATEIIPLLITVKVLFQ